MSDARDAVAEAVAANKRLAASLMVKIGELRDELDRGHADEARRSELELEIGRLELQLEGVKKELAELRDLPAKQAGDQARALAAQVAEIAGGMAPSAPAGPALSRDQKDALAKAEFEALRARRLGVAPPAAAPEGGAPAAEGPGGDDPPPAPAPPRPKKTM